MKSGPEQLVDYMKRRRFTARDLAAYLGWSEVFISKLVNGHRKPGLTNALKIEEHTGIPARAWVSRSLDVPGRAIDESAVMDSDT